MNTLQEALDIIRERGMCKKVQQDEQGRVCLHGALRIAQNGVGCQGTPKEMNALYNSIQLLFPNRLHKWIGPDSLGFASFNNHYDTTQEDLELALKHAIHSLETDGE